MPATPRGRKGAAEALRVHSLADADDLRFGARRQTPFLFIEINGSYYRNNKQTATTPKSSAMDYSSDENISGELGDRPPRELESPSKIQKSSLLLESTRERTAAKKERSLDVEVLDQLKQKGRIISNRIAGKDKQEKMEVQAGKAGLNSIAASLYQDEKGGQAGLKPDTTNLNSIPTLLKQEYSEEDEELQLNKAISALLSQNKVEAHVGLQLDTINLNSITASIKQENNETKGDLVYEQRTLKTYTNHFNLLLIYVKKMKSFPEVTKGLSFKAPSSKKRTLCRGLSSFLQKVYTQPIITIVSSPIFDSASDELVVSIRHKIGRLLQDLSPSAIRHYENIASLLQLKLPPSKMKIVKEERGFGYEELAKLDVLSLFFYRIYAYDELPQKSIIPNKTLFKIFDIKNKSLLLSYQRKFQLMQQVLVYDNQEYFHDDITFLCLVNLKSKISNLAHWMKKKNKDLPDEKSILQKTVQPAHISSKQIGFKFSEIVDITFRYMAIEKHPLQTQLVIFDKVEQLSKKESIELVKMQLIKLALEFSVSLKAVLDIYCNMKTKPYFIKLLRKSYQTPLKESLERYNWLSRNKKCSINSILNLDYQVRECVQSRQAHNNPKIQVLCEVAREKYIRLDRIQWCLLSIERQMTNKQPIHISKHEFSFNKIKNNKEQQEDLTAVLILATKGPKKILFKITAQRTISDHDFIVILVNFLESKEITGFPLIISEFKRRKFLQENAVLKCFRNFKKACSSQVYFSNNPIYFITHLFLVEQFKMILHNDAASINKDNFHDVFESTVDSTINDYRIKYMRKYGITNQ